VGGAPGRQSRSATVSLAMTGVMVDASRRGSAAGMFQDGSLGTAGDRAAVVTLPRFLVFPTAETPHKLCSSALS
jgi:hypothetical protein